MKKIMILGGGKNQVPLIQKSKELGLFVVLCDYYEINPGKQYADIHYVVSTHDYDKLLRIAKDEKVDGIISNSEPVLHIVAQLTEELNLPSIGSEIMKLFLNKNLMRDHLEKVGFNNVRYKYCESVEEAIRFFNEVGKKAIIKPVDSSASKGVFTVNAVEDIKNHFEECSFNNRRKNKIIIEEYIEGIEFTVDGLCVNGKHITLAISKKDHFKYNENIANELFFSYSDSEFNYEQLREINDRIAESTGMPFGMTHSEYKYENGEFHFIEMSARGGGVFIGTSIVPYVSGVDNVKHYILASIDKRYDYQISYNEINKLRCGILKFFDCSTTQALTVNAIKGLDYIEGEKNIIQYELFFNIGDKIKRAADDSERIGYYIALAETQDELMSITENVNEKFSVIFEE